VRRWREFRSEFRAEARSGFVDGDLVERLLELSADRQAKVGSSGDLRVASYPFLQGSMTLQILSFCLAAQVAAAVAVPVEELVRRVEELARIH